MSQRSAYRSTAIDVRSEVLVRALADFPILFLLMMLLVIVIGFEKLESIIKIIVNGKKK
jgi:hypothetical protein